MYICYSGTDNSKVGRLTIVGWLNEGTGSVVDMQGSNVSINPYPARTESDKTLPPV